MDVYEAIAQRRSVRAYQDRPIEDEKLQRVLDAARNAPSARNRQSWKFVVVRDPGIRAEIIAATEQDWMRTAPVIVAGVATGGGYTMYCGVPADPVDVAIALDHLALAATAEGLGTCWVGHFLQNPCRKALGVPDDATIIELVTMGYPADKAHGKTRKPYDEVVAFDRFA